jgi:hypothetical protein
LIIIADGVRGSNLKYPNTGERYISVLASPLFRHSLRLDDWRENVSQLNTAISKLKCNVSRLNAVRKLLKRFTLLPPGKAQRDSCGFCSR